MSGVLGRFVDLDQLNLAVVALAAVRFLVDYTAPAKLVAAES
jgi:hypothetical protein